MQRVEKIGVSSFPGVEAPRDRMPSHVRMACSADIERPQLLNPSSYMNRRPGCVFGNEVQNNL